MVRTIDKLWAEHMRSLVDDITLPGYTHSREGVVSRDHSTREVGCPQKLYGWPSSRLQSVLEDHKS